jgi:F-box-like
MLPEDVLLEIFDSYRQTFEREPDYEWVWNGKDGWFNLAHVCQKWRCVVLSSSSRLRVRLLFTPHRAPRAIVLTRLPSLPIVVDYGSTTPRTLREQNRAAAALRYPDRVRRIVLKASDLELDGVYRAIKRSFPSLESFECASGPKFDLPTTIFRGYAPSLRHLHLENVRLGSLSPLLSSTTGLVDLNLEVDNVVCPSPAPPLLTHLQGMPCLRRLQLRLPTPHFHSISGPVLPVGVPDIVRLLGLTHFQFIGSRYCLEALAAGLAAPFLQDLNIKFLGHLSTHPQHLPRFIRDVEGLFFAVLVESMPSHCRISLLTRPHSPDEPPRRITVEDTTSYFVWSGPAMLRARLSTVEQLFFHDPYPLPYEKSLLGVQLDGHSISWREFFEQLRNVKILRVQQSFVLDVARFLSQNCGEPPSHLLPALEEIELRSAFERYTRIYDKASGDVLSAFDPFITARQQAGCPVRIYWIAEPALPSPYSYW